MPYKFEGTPINNPKNDRRVKLTEEDRHNIRSEYEQGGISIRGLARKYNVDKRTIQFTLFPERLEKARKQFVERRKDGRYYDKDKHRAYTKRYRDHKKSLHEKGELTGGDNDEDEIELEANVRREGHVDT